MSEIREHMEVIGADGVHVGSGFDGLGPAQRSRISTN